MFSGSVSRRGSLFGFLAGVAAVPLATPSCGAPASGCGLVVLTVGGLVGAPNRPPFDEKRDRFFQHNNLDFKQARAYHSPTFRRCSSNLRQSWKEAA